MVAEKFLNPVHNDSVYVIPHRNNNDFLKKINIVTTDISKETCIVSEIMNFSPYYEVRKNNQFLFKCIYIEGYAQHRGIQEIERKWHNYLWDIFHGDRNKENSEFFFIVEINRYTPYIEIPDIKKWLPYLE